MTPEDQHNAATYGLCQVCGAPRTLHRFVETDANGHRHAWQRIICTRSPVMHYAQDRMLSAPPATTPPSPTRTGD